VGVGLVAALAVPVGVVFSRWVGNVSLLDASLAIPVAVVLGLVAVLLARRARGTAEWTLGRVGGLRAARLGLLLGAVAICLALTAALALGFFALLVVLGK